MFSIHLFSPSLRTIEWVGLGWKGPLKVPLGLPECPLGRGGAGACPAACLAALPPALRQMLAAFGLSWGASALGSVFLPYDLGFFLFPSPGYGMSGDLSSLAATCSALKDTEKQARGVVDLLAVDKQVRMSTWRCVTLCLLPVPLPHCCQLTAWAVPAGRWHNDLFHSWL